MTNNSKHNVSFLKKKETKNSLYKSVCLRFNVVIRKRSLNFFLRTDLKLLQLKSHFFLKKLNFKLIYYKKVFIQIFTCSVISFAILIVSSFLFGFFGQLNLKYPGKTVFLTIGSPRRRTLPLAALSYNRFLSSSFSNPGLRSIYNDNSNYSSSNIYKAQQALGSNRSLIRSSFDTEKEKDNNLQNNSDLRSPGFNQFLKERHQIAKTIALCTGAYYCGQISAAHLPTIINVVGTVLKSMSNIESLHNLAKQVNTSEKKLKIKDTKLTMDIITEQKLAQSDRLNSIQGDTSLRENIRSAYTADFTSYGKEEAATLCRLDMMQQLFEDRKIEIYKHCFERGLVQPISNFHLATAYLSWWSSEYPLKKDSDLFIQFFLSKVALITKRVSNDIQDELKLETHLDKVQNDFLILQVIGKAICYFRKQIIILKYQFPSNEASPADCLTKDLKQKLIFESFRQGFRKVSEQSTFISYDHQEIAKLVEQLLQTHFID